MATINIRISPATSNICVTAIKATNNFYCNSAWSSSDGRINLTVPEAGEYLLKYNIVSKTPTPKMGIIGPDRIILQNFNSSITINVDYIQLVTYTICIDEINKIYNYLDDAIGMEFGSAAWDEMPIFDKIKLCEFSNGQVVNYINTYSSNSLYDLMVEFTQFAYRIYRENNKLYVSITNDKETALGDFRKYNYDAFSYIYPADLTKFYIGAFKGYIDESTNKLRSIAGVKPTTNLLYSEAQTAAEINGTHYHITNYAQLKALQCLYLIKYGPQDAQNIIGRGIVDLLDDRSTILAYYTGYNSNVSADNSTSILNEGLTYGITTDGEHHMRLFGIEDFWGNIFEWIENVKSDGNRNLQTSYNQKNVEDLPELKDQQIFITKTWNNMHGRISTTADISQAGLAAINADKKESPDEEPLPQSLWHDCCILQPDTKAMFGGGWADGNGAGPFCLYFYNSGEEKYGIRETGRAVGARLAYS